MSGLIPRIPGTARYWSAILYLAFPVMTVAAEISQFRFTNVDGFFVLRYLTDEQSLSAQNVTSRKESHQTFQEELAVNSYAYVFHPDMLNMNLSGSLLYDQSDFDSLDGDTNPAPTDSKLVNYFARLDFLEKKPYPFSFYYDQQNPSVYTGLTGYFIQENVKYGFDLSLLEPFSPVQITVNAFRQTSQGESIDQVVDDIQEQSNIRFYHAYGAGNFAELSHQFNRLDTRSGNPNFPILERIFTTNSSNLYTRNIFGSDRQFQLSNTLSYNTQDEYPVRESFRFLPYLGWRHSNTVNSFLRYDYSNSTEEELQAEDRKLALGVAWSGQETNGNFDVHGESNEKTGFEYRNAGTNYSLTYVPLALSGALKLNYSGYYNRYDQKTEVNLLQVFEEEHVLAGTAAVFLSRQFIDIDPLITPITVRNTSRTQIYVEGFDYRIIRIGSGVQIQRLAGGNIIDPQAVYVDYWYKTGGTFQYDMVNHALGLSFTYARYYELYVRYYQAQQNLLEGNPAIPLNAINRSTAGIRADKPLSNGMVLGGDISYENNIEDISSYVKENYEAYTEMPLPYLTDVRISARRVIVDNENTIEDVYLDGYILRVNSQPWLRTVLSLESSYESDTGGSLDRLLRQHRLQLAWRVRQLSVSFNAQYIIEEQGDTERDNWLAKFVVKREF